MNALNPIPSAITKHREAHEAFRTKLHASFAGGRDVCHGIHLINQAIAVFEVYIEATISLNSTVCRDRADARSLLAYLSRWLAIETVSRGRLAEHYDRARIRAADLSLLLAEAA